jgi:hypothetical protein
VSIFKKNYGIFLSAAERVLNFSILYLHICGGVNKFRFCILGVKIGAKSVT